MEGGEFYCDSSYSNVAEAALDNLRAAGFRLKLRPLERAAFMFLPTKAGLGQFATDSLLEEAGFELPPEATAEPVHSGVALTARVAHP